MGEPRAQPFRAFVDFERPTWGKARRIRCESLASNFKIEKGVPIPSARRNNGKKIRGIAAALRKLGKTDSVLLPVHHGYASATASRVLGAANYTTRREGNGVRVWRTK